jgi:hypothetical protein
MKIKINFFIVLTLILSHSLFGQTYNKQHTYLDALELANILNSFKLSNNDTLYDTRNLDEAYFNIVNKYTHLDLLHANPLINGYILGDRQYGSNEISRKKEIISYASSEFTTTSLSSASWQASAINSVTNFMAGRFKQESLQVSIDQIFKQSMAGNDSEIIKCIFPKTYKQIESLYGLGASSYYTSDLLLLRQAAQMDITQLSKNIINNQETIFPSFINEPKLKDMLLMGNYIVEYGQQGLSLDHLISSLSNEIYSSDSTVYRMLNVADLISQALLNKEGSEDTWVNPIIDLPVSSNSLKNLEIRFFYGLLYEQLILIPEFKTYFEEQIAYDEELIAAKIQELIRFVNQLNNTYNYLQSKEFSLNSPEEIAIYIQDINQTIGSFTNTLNTNQILDLHDSIVEVSSKYLSIVEASLNNDYQRVIPLLIIEFGDYMDISIKTVRTITFISQLATTESADNLEALLSSYALPIGSSSIKRRSSFNVSVNGYVGLTGGWETAYGSQKNQTSGNIGLSAPIGISTTICNGYLTPFVSIIDLGSMVNLRLNNDTTSNSNLKFEQFFTPGIGLFVNARDFPITAGLHFNYIPNLRTIEYEIGTTTITESNRDVSRINFLLLVDIPFFTLYNRDKSY